MKDTRLLIFVAGITLLPCPQYSNALPPGLAGNALQFDGDTRNNLVRTDGEKYEVIYANTKVDEFSVK